MLGGVMNYSMQSTMRSMDAKLLLPTTVEWGAKTFIHFSFLNFWLGIFLYTPSCQNSFPSLFLLVFFGFGFFCQIPFISFKPLLKAYFVSQVVHSLTVKYNSSIYCSDKSCKLDTLPNWEELGIRGWSLS